MGQPGRARRRSDKRKPARPRWIRRQLGRCWGYSLLLLAATVAGTYWLSGMTAQGPSLAQRMEAVGGHSSLAAVSQPLPLAVHPRAGVPLHHHVRRAAAWPAPVHLPAQLEAATPPAPADRGPTRYLSPLRMPAESRHAALMRLHHYGRVVLGLRLAPGGGVAGVWLQQASGDAVLDRYALQRVRDWQFAPPPPGDDTGLLALRFEAARR